MSEIKLFNKWSFENVVCSDPSLSKYLPIGKKYARLLPHSAGRYNSKRFKRANCPLVERFLCALLMHGRNSGKKLKAIRIIRNSFILINLHTGKNPLQVLTNAIVNSGPREDSTRIGSHGAVRRQAVDVSPFRRVNVAIHLIVMGARETAFKSIKSISECLADELINASRGSSNSFAVKKKDEMERVAKSNR
jgi:small subunit ribosomal protein S5e